MGEAVEDGEQPRSTLTSSPLFSFQGIGAFPEHQAAGRAGLLGL